MTVTKAASIEHAARHAVGGPDALTGYAPSMQRVTVTSGPVAALPNQIVGIDTTAGTFEVDLSLANTGHAPIVLKWVAGTVAPTWKLSGSDHVNTSAGPTSGTFSFLNHGLRFESDGTSLWTITADDLPLSQLDARYAATGGAVTESPIVVSNSSGDVAAIVAAITAGTSGGFVDGKWGTVQGKVARISTPTTIALGYSNTQNADLSVSTPQKVKLTLDILPDAGLGAALTIKGGYGVELDINVLGGGAMGTVTDVATTATSTTVSSPSAIAAGLKAGAVVFITGSGPNPEGAGAQPTAASVRSVNAGAGTFVVSEAPEITLSGATMNWFDVAVRLEDCQGLKLNIYGKAFGGCLIAADATDDVTKRLRSIAFGRIMALQCKMGIFWKSIEAQGSLGLIWSISPYGDYFGACDDMHWIHYEGGIGNPPSRLAQAYIWFDRCGYMNDLSIAVGDRALQAGILMTGATSGPVNLGRFKQIRVTTYQAQVNGIITNGSNQLTGLTTIALTASIGQYVTGPGIPDGTTVTAVSGSGNGYSGAGVVTMSAPATATSSGQNVYFTDMSGVKLVGIGSVTIGMLDTAHCYEGLSIIGGGQNRINVLNHKSESTDCTPLVIRPGTTSTAPIIDVHADYRFELRYAVDIASGLAAGADIRFSGYIEGMHQIGGATGKYAIRSASVAAVLDVSNLHQLARTGLLGLVDSTTVTLVGVNRARLDNQIPAKGVVFQSDGAGSALAIPPGATGYVLTSQADGSLAPAPSAVTPATDTQQFNTPGAATWTKPTTGVAKMVHVRIWAGGGAGGSGACMASGVLATGGGGGAAGGYTERWYNAADLAATVALVIGAGGVGGAAVTTSSTAGNPGTAGGNSTFGGASLWFGAANGGGLGAGGTNSGAANGGTGGSAGAAAGGSAGASSATGGAGSGATLSVTGGAPTGGGAGGGITTGAVASAGGNGGSIAGAVAGGVGGAINTNGTAGSNFPLSGGGPGLGGGGGGSSVTGVAGSGGAGGTYGAGGGGGGASLNTHNSGAGGNGAGGQIIVETYF